MDSGDLAYLSCESRKFFQRIEEEFRVPGFGKMNITASNDLNEETLDALNKQVNCFEKIMQVESSLFTFFLKGSILDE